MARDYSLLVCLGIYLLAMGFTLLYFGIQELGFFSIRSDNICTILDLEDNGENVRFLVSVESVNGSIIIDCNKENCSEFKEKYQIDSEYICYLYPNANLISFDSDLANFGRVATSVGSCLVSTSLLGLIIWCFVEYKKTEKLR